MTTNKDDTHGLTHRSIQTWSLFIIASVALFAALSYTKAAFIPLVFALILYSLISDSTQWLAKRFQLNRWISLPLVTLAFLGLMSLTIFLAANSIDKFVQGLSQYQYRIQEFILWISAQASKIGYEVDTIRWSETAADLPLLNWATGLTGSLFSFLGNFALVMIFLIFLLLGDNPTSPKSDFITEVRHKISSFVLVKTLGSILIAVAVAILLASLGVEMIFLFAAITFIGNFVPNLGSLVSAVVPIPVILIRHGAGPEIIIFLSVSLLLQFLSGNFFETKLLGMSLDLHPVTILVCLILWGLIWGVPGMFLAVPISFTIKKVLSYNDMTKPLSELMAGRVNSQK